MSKGNPVVQVRVPMETLQEVNDTIAKRNATTSGEFHTLSSFVLAAIREKLDKMKRSRRPRRRARGRAPEISALDDYGGVGIS